MSIRHSRTMLSVIIGVSLVLASSFTVPAKFQDTPKSRSAQKSQPQDNTGKPSSDVIGYWQALANRSKEALAVSWNKGTGTPHSIIGKVQAPVSGASEMSARWFLMGNAPLFKMSGDTSDLELTRAYESVLGEHYVFQQTYGGVPVYGSQVSVHFNKAGDVVAVNNTYAPDIKLDSVKPGLSRSNAAARGTLVLKGDAVSASNEQLVVFRVNDSFALAWRVVIQTDGPTWEVFLDAQDGKFLQPPRDINRYVNGTGQVYNVNAVVATHDNSLRDNNDAAGAVPASAYRIVTLPGLLGNGMLDGAYASSSKTKKQVFDAGNNFIFDRSSDGFSETMGYYYIDYAERYIQSLGFNNVNNRQQVFSVNRLKIDNSFYSPQSKDITFGLGGVDDAEDAEVIWHEYGHSIQDNQVENFGSSLEAGSMGEGFGDYWAASVGAQFSGGFQDLCLAEWDATSYSSSNPPCLRRLDSPKHYPEDVAGEVHDDGEMWSAALWGIRGSIGAAKSDKAIIAAHFLLTPTASFNDGANAIVMAAHSLNYKANELNSIRTILRNRGFTVTV
jgi:Zn-dependent metalloprotease